MEINQQKSEENQLTNGEITGKDPETGRFIEGNDYGKGRPPGSKNFDVIFELAIRKIVEEKKIDIKDPEMEMVMKAVIEALKGNYAYFRDLMDRKYGKPTQPIDMNAQIEEKQIRELVLTTRQILELQQPDNKRISQDEI